MLMRSTAEGRQFGRCSEQIPSDHVLEANTIYRDYFSLLSVLGLILVQARDTRWWSFTKNAV